MKLRDGEIVRLPEIPKKVRESRELYFSTFNIVNRGFKMPDKVCILAPGFNAGPKQENAYGKITADFIIAVNKSPLIQLGGRVADMWLVTDNECMRTDWFKIINESFNGLICFSTWVCITALPVPCVCDNDKFYTITMHDVADLDGLTFSPVPGRFRPDITVVGTAMRMAQLCGAKYIELCGVDMYGNKYYDCSTRHLPYYEDKPLDSRDRLDSAIIWMREQGVDIISLSTTALKTL